MNAESYASYRAALPPECLGERDDDDAPGGPVGPPTWYAAVWLQDVPFRDVDTGVVTHHRAPVSRSFSLASHAKPYEAALRWARAMARRHGGAWLEGGWGDGMNFEGRV